MEGTSWLASITSYLLYSPRDNDETRYNESYKIAADSELLVRYLMTGGLSVTYLKEYVVRMRMGGLSTDSAKRKKMWGEDIRVYSSHGLWPTLTKLEKMAWKVPQFVLALLKG